MSRKYDLSIILANCLDHFDTALYGFLAPILAPLFFPKQEYIVQLILAYGILATSAVTRPLGALIFGICGWRGDPLKTLRIALLGVGFSTFAVGCLPTFEQAGWLAPSILLLTRMITGIFGAGETTIAGLYLLEKETKTSPIMRNSWYEASVMWGIIMASFVSLWIDVNNWRLPFLAGGSLAFFGFYLRVNGKKSLLNEPLEAIHALDAACPILSVEQQYRSIKDKKFRHFLSMLPTVKQFISIVFSGGLGYVTYEIPFILMNSFIPLVTHISFKQMMALNTALLIVDLLLMPVIGYVIRYFSPHSVKRTSVWVLCLTGIPLFYFILNASMIYITFVRLWIVFWGVTLACVQRVWLHERFTLPSKYLIVGLGNTIGSALIGRFTSTICLILYYKTGFSFVPGVYLSCISLALIWAMSSYGRVSST